MSTTYAREILALGIPPRAVMHLVLEDILATLGEWTADVMTCDELELVRQARVHIENAEHCMLMLLRPSEALCEPQLTCTDCGATLPWHKNHCQAPGSPDRVEHFASVLAHSWPPESIEKEPPGTAGTVRAVDERGTFEETGSPPRLSYLGPGGET